MEHLDVGHQGGSIESANDAALLDRSWISLRRHHHGHARPVPPPRRLHRLEPAVHGRVEQFQQARLQPHHQRLALGVAKAGVEFEHLGALCREHQAGIEHAVKRHLRPPHRVGRGHENPGLDVGQHGGIDERGGAVGSHSARVGPGVAIVGRLVILERRQRDDRSAVGDGHHAHLDPIEPLFDEDALGRGGKLLITPEAVEGRQRLGAILAHKHPLAGGESIRLHHHRHVFTGLEIVAGPGHAAKLAEHRRRDVAAVHDLLAKQLASLELRGLRRRAEDSQARGLEGIDDAGDQRRLRSHHGQVDLPRLSKSDQRLNVIRGNRDVLRDSRRAGVARGDEHFGAVAGQFPGDRMLPAATSDHENTTRCRCGRAA